jgi:hypothetical protein
MKGEYDPGIAHSLARSGADVGRRRLYVLRVPPCTRQKKAPREAGPSRVLAALTGVSTALTMGRFSAGPREYCGAMPTVRSPYLKASAVAS